jgi:hypothetical protein
MHTLLAACLALYITFKPLALIHGSLYHIWFIAVFAQPTQTIDIITRRPRDSYC